MSIMELAEQKKEFPKIQEYLRMFDFELLEEEFQKYFDELGLASDEIMKGFIGKDRISKKGFLNSIFEGTGGRFDYRKGGIKMSESLFWGLSRKNQGSSGSEKEREQEKEHQQLKNELELMLCHEEAHAMSFEPVKKGKLFFESTMADKKEVGQSGYAKIFERSRLWGLYHGEEGEFDMFNEGITELIARDIYERYKKSQIKKYPDEKIKEFTPLDESESSYKHELGFVNSILDKISKNTGLERDVIKRGIIRGYFLREDLGSEKMKRLFGDVVGESFFDGLREWESGPLKFNALFSFLVIATAKWSEQSKKRIKKWFELVERASRKKQT